MFQLLRLQIAEGSFNRNLAEGNRIRIREIEAPRGLIYDSNGTILAKNKPSFNLEIYPLDLPKDSQERDNIFRKLSKSAQVPLDEIKDKVNQKGFTTYDPIILKENIDRETAMILEVKTVNLPGVVVAKKPMREYLPVAGLGPLLGYVGRMSQEEIKKNPQYRMSANIGKSGLEAVYEEDLRGDPGVLEVEVDSQGRQQRQLSATNPLPGNNLILSINAELEEMMIYSLTSNIKAAFSSGGAAVALNPKNGQIMAMASYPTFDNNIFMSSDIEEKYQELLEDPGKPMFNRAVSGTYPSGSIIKPFVAAAGLQEGVITENTTIDDPGEIKVGNWIYPDWKNHGLVNVRKAIAESCNVFFYAVSGGWEKIRGLGIEKLRDYLQKFGFGEGTGVDLPSEAVGIVPDPEWKEEYKNEIWYLGDTYHLGIGQGDFLITPLQMARAIAVIANGGELLRPKLVAKISDEDGEIIHESEKEVQSSNFVDGGFLQVVREGMRLGVTSGSSRRLNSLSEAAAAKTGTAQFGNEGKTHSWMVAFAPYHDPEIVVVALVEEGGEGHVSAGPVVYDILNEYFSK